MTPPVRTAANRRNATKSTGPRTRAGKDRVSRNALRHGLATDIGLDPSFTVQIDVIARAIAGPQITGPAALDAARSAAASELDLIRIRKIHSDLMAKLAVSIAAIEDDADDLPMLSTVQEGLRAGLNRKELFQRIKEQQKTRPSSRVSALIQELAQVERYERRAMSRRRGFLRALDALRLEALSRDVRLT